MSDSDEDYSVKSIQDKKVKDAKDDTEDHEAKAHCNTDDHHPDPPNRQMTLNSDPSNSEESLELRFKCPYCDKVFLLLNSVFRHCNGQYNRNPTCKKRKSAEPPRYAENGVIIWDKATRKPRKVLYKSDIDSASDSFVKSLKKKKVKHSIDVSQGREAIVYCDTGYPSDREIDPVDPGSFLSADDNATSDEPNYYIRYQCSYCDKIFNTEGSVTRHCNGRHHRDPACLKRRSAEPPRFRKDGSIIWDKATRKGRKVLLKVIESCGDCKICKKNGILKVKMLAVQRRHSQ